MTRSPGRVDSSISTDWRTASSPVTSASEPVGGNRPRSIAGHTGGTCRDRPRKAKPVVAMLSPPRSRSSPGPGSRIVQGASAHQVQLWSRMPSNGHARTVDADEAANGSWRRRTLTTVVQRLTPTNSAPPWHSEMLRWSRSPLTRTGPCRRSPNPARPACRCARHAGTSRRRFRRPAEASLTPSQT